MAGIIMRKKDREARAEKEAAALREKYYIDYGDDPSTYKLVDKETGKSAVVELGGLGVDEKLFTPQRRLKKLIGKKVQQGAEVYSGSIPKSKSSSDKTVETPETKEAGKPGNTKDAYTIQLERRIKTLEAKKGSQGSVSGQSSKAGDTYVVPKKQALAEEIKVDEIEEVEADKEKKPHNGELVRGADGILYMKDEKGDLNPVSLEAEKQPRKNPHEFSIELQSKLWAFLFGADKLSPREIPTSTDYVKPPIVEVDTALQNIGNNIAQDSTGRLIEKKRR